MLVCDKCHKFETVNKNDLKNHAAGCERVEILYGECDKKFNSERSLKNHMRKEHEPLQCDVCNRYLKNIHSLRKHRKLHNNQPLQCDICKKYLKCADSLRKHQKTHYDKLFQCDICKKHLKSTDSLKRHRKSHEEFYRCVHCNRDIKYKSSFNRHIKKGCKKQPLNAYGSALSVGIQTSSPRKLRISPNSLPTKRKTALKSESYESKTSFNRLFSGASIITSKTQIPSSSTNFELMPLEKSSGNHESTIPMLNWDSVQHIPTTKVLRIVVKENIRCNFCSVLFATRKLFTDHLAECIIASTSEKFSTNLSGKLSTTCSFGSEVAMSTASDTEISSNAENFENILVKSATGISAAQKPIYPTYQNLVSTQSKTNVMQPTVTKPLSNESADYNKLWKSSTPVTATPANQTVNSKFFAFAEKNNTRNGSTFGTVISSNSVTAHMPFTIVNDSQQQLQSPNNFSSASPIVRLSATPFSFNANSKTATQVFTSFVISQPASTSFQFSTASSTGSVTKALSFTNTTASNAVKIIPATSSFSNLLSKPAENSVKKASSTPFLFKPTVTSSRRSMNEFGGFIKL